MVPDKFNMVDMGGIDLILMQGEEVPGLYNRLVESITQCRYQCLYNWLFDGVIIPPTYVELEVNEDDEVVINEGVTVTPEDVIHIYSIEPPAPEPEIISLLAEENGTYSVPTGIDGFNPVTVNIPSYTPVINSLSVTENGTYTAPTGVDGYSPVTVNVPTGGSEFVTPDYQGLSYAYLTAAGQFYQSSEGQIYFINCFSVSAGVTYAIFVGQVTSDRNRCAFFSGKTISDFMQYIETGGPQTLIYNPTTPISSGDPASDVRYIFTPQSNGEVILVTSRSSIQAISYCAELS